MMVSLTAKINIHTNYVTFLVMKIYSTDVAEIYKHGGASSNTKIWMDQVNCAASHTRLENCRRSSWGVNDCSHNEDIGIRCFGKYIGEYST